MLENALEVADGTLLAQQTTSCKLLQPENA